MTDVEAPSRGNEQHEPERDQLNAEELEQVAGGEDERRREDAGQVQTWKW